MDDTWALLRELDDPDYLEHPRGYHHGAARARFNQLAAQLDQRFDCVCAVDRHVEDASHHGVIVIPAAATISGDHITVTVSNFGDLVAVTLGNPGTYSEDEEDVLFDRDDRRRIEDELRALGYRAISEHLLWNTYDGVSNLREHTPSWWTRFFDYL